MPRTAFFWDERCFWHAGGNYAFTLPIGEALGAAARRCVQIALMEQFRPKAQQIGCAFGHWEDKRQKKRYIMADAEDDRIVKLVELNAPIRRVWKALTDHEEFGQWFRVNLDQPFAVGARSTGQMTYPGHEGVPWIAYVEVMQPERLFSFRWYASDNGATEQSEDQPGILVEFRLKEVRDGTRLTITESGFSCLPDPGRIEQMRSSEEGWNIQAENIAEYLST